MERKKKKKEIIPSAPTSYSQITQGHTKIPNTEIYWKKLYDYIQIL